MTVSLGSGFLSAYGAIDAMQNAQDDAAFAAVVSKALSGFGFEHFILTELPGAHQRFDEVVSLYRWPPGWFNVYCNEGLAWHDPVLRRCYTSSDPFDWDEVEVLDRQRDVMAKARDFGMNRGFSVPVYGVDNYAACFSLSGRYAEFAPESRPTLHLVALYAAERARALHKRVQVRSNPLTAREGEVLKWAAIGKTAADTAEILAVSERTVTAHTVNAMQKLGAANKTQAVVNAMQQRFIHI